MFSPKKLKEKRTELGFSQAEIARKLNISRMSFSAWESGKTKPNQKNLSILADIFDVEESFFESEYTIVQNYLLLTDENKLAAEDYVEQLLHLNPLLKMLCHCSPIRCFLKFNYLPDQVKVYLMSMKQKLFIQKMNIQVLI